MNLFENITSRLKAILKEPYWKSDNGVNMRLHMLARDVISTTCQEIGVTPEAPIEVKSKAFAVRRTEHEVATAFKTILAKYISGQIDRSMAVVEASAALDSMLSHIEEHTKSGLSRRLKLGSITLPPELIESFRRIREEQLGYFKTVLDSALPSSRLSTKAAPKA